MTISGAYIQDIHLLEQLNNRFECSASTMANIDEGVVNYVNDVRNKLQEQLDYIQDMLQESELQLSEAESSRDSCVASQQIDPETGILSPSCEWAESAVRTAQMEVDKWKSKYEQGKRILEECQREIGEYNGYGGGHSLIQNMCGKLTPNISQILHDCIERLQDILGLNVVVTADIETCNISNEQNQSLSKDAPNHAYNGISEKTAVGDGNRANRAVQCPNCKRPAPLCVCKTLHV